MYTRLYTGLNLMTHNEYLKLMTKETALKSYNVEDYI